MSIHRSLAARSALSRARNVLTRQERCETLKQKERWDESTSSVFHLPKVRVAVIAVKKKVKKAAAAEGAAAAPGAAAPGAPAADAAKGAAGPKGAAAAPAAKAGADKKGKK